MKHELHLKDRTEPIELYDEDILCNDVFMPWEHNPNRVKLFVVGHEYGPLFAVWGVEHEVLDNAVDAGLMDSFMVEPEDIEDYRTGGTDECPEYDVAYLGNASEPFDLQNCWYSEVVFKPERDYKLLCALAYAQGAGQETLAK